MCYIEMVMTYILYIFILLSFSHIAISQPCNGQNEGIDKCENSRLTCKNGRKNHPKNNCKQLNNSELYNNTIKVDYEGFSVWLDCQRHGAIKFQYNAQHDTGHFPRANKFSLDAQVTKNCQQMSTHAYGHHYDRGHLVPANHLDSSASAIKATNNMTNILPQAANMNRGAWLVTEEITECYRDISELLIIGGVIWGNNPKDDFFVKSHGITTPDAFWKVIVRGSGQDEQAIAWIVPNSNEATRDQLDNYLVTVREIEALTGEKIPVADYIKEIKTSTSWLIPIGCNKG